MIINHKSKSYIESSYEYLTPGAVPGYAARLTIM